MSKNPGGDPTSSNQGVQGVIQSNSYPSSEEQLLNEDSVSIDKLELSSKGSSNVIITSTTSGNSTASSRPTSSGTPSSRPTSSGTRPTTSSGSVASSSRPSSSSGASTRPSSSGTGGGGARSDVSSSSCTSHAGGRQDCHSRTSSLSSGDGLLLSVSALARGGGSGRSDPNSTDSQQYMGQSGTRQAGAGADVLSGPPSGEREDPEGLTDGEEEIQSGLGSLLAVDKRVFGKLQEELTAAHTELRLKEEEVTRLSGIRDAVESELQELTASLFQEAHRMVREANVKAAYAEKALAESNMKVDGLMMEVAALKALVITSTPSTPNPHLHPQISGGKSNTPRGGGNSAPGTPTKERLVLGGPADETDGATENRTEEKFMDPVLRSEYLEWKKSPKMDPELPFFVRIYREDINPCLEFPNVSLSASIKEAVFQNTICISPVKESMELPRNCELLEQPRRCTHIITLETEGESSKHFVSQLARNRIASVCDFLLYCRYITQGLVKQHCNEVYWQIISRRRNMILARLGFTEL